MPSDTFFSSPAGPSTSKPAQRTRPGAGKPSTRGRNRKTASGPKTGPKIGPRAGGEGMDRKKGFQVGPAHAPRNAYLGKAKKIKAGLIMKSKIKREYAKVLKEEGMESNRLKPRTGKGEPPRPDGAINGSSGPALTSPTLMDSKLPRSILKTTHAESSTSHRPSSIAHPTRRPDPRQNDSRPGPQRTDSTVSRSIERKALSPADIGPPMPQTSLRELKKEAYKKFHRPRSSVPTGHTGARTTGQYGARSASGSQPNLGARMGVLLEKIKRDKAAA